MCGDMCLPELWFKHHHTLDEPPALVAILAGGNDFFDRNYPDKDDFVAKFSELIIMIRKIRGDTVPIYIFQCCASCCSSAGSPSDHPMQDPWVIESTNLLDEYTRATVVAAGGSSECIFYHHIQIQLDLPTDYATMMHWSVSGQEKIARAMAQFISSVPDKGG